MKSKALISIAVASAFGLSAAAYAGPGHDKWVAAGEEQYPAMIFGSEQPATLAVVDIVVIESIGGTSSSFEGSVGGSYGSDSSPGSDSSLDATMSSDELSSLSMDETLALANEGIYSDFILVSATPVSLESWDLYVIDATADELAALDDFMISPYDLVVLHDFDTSQGHWIAL